MYKIEPTEDKPFKTPPPDYSIVGFDLWVSGWFTNYKDPDYFSESSIVALFKEISEHPSVSDIIIATDYPVLLKVRDRGLYCVTRRPISADECNSFADTLSNDKLTAQNVISGTPASGLRVLTNNDVFVDEYTAYNSKRTGIVRKYRYEMTGVTTKRASKTLHIVLRPLTLDPVDHQFLGLEKDFMQGCMVKDGLVVIAAGTGQGKTTTIGAVIKLMLESDPLSSEYNFPVGQYMTLQDPQELDFSNIISTHSAVFSSQIGATGNIDSYATANRSMMRRSPDFALVGELRDFDTISSAIELGLAGCGVIATTHANDIASIISRLITRYPLDAQAQVANDILQIVRMLASQRLIWVIDKETGKEKRKSIREYLIFTDPLKQHLNKYTSDMNSLYSEIDRIVQNNEWGVKSFTQQANEMYAQGLITRKTYFELARNPQENFLKLQESLSESTHTQADEEFNNV